MHRSAGKTLTLAVLAAGALGHALTAPRRRTIPRVWTRTLEAAAPKQGGAAMEVTRAQADRVAEQAAAIRGVRTA
jgi:hypothetical protein